MVYTIWDDIPKKGILEGGFFGESKGKKRKRRVRGRKIRRSQPESLMDIATSKEAKEAYKATKIGARVVYSEAKKGIGFLKSRFRKKKSIYD